MKQNKHKAYTTTGAKLAKQVYEQDRLQSSTVYSGAFVYEDDAVSYLLFSEGRLLYEGNRTWKFEYHLKDHLGNVRVAFEPENNNKITQKNDYYPFGMQIQYNTFELPGTNKYTYNSLSRTCFGSKEMQDDFGLDWLDYGARFYDAEIGRWHVVDPMAEDYYSFSPYNYVAGNPIRLIDPNGMWIDDYFNKNGEYLGSDEAKTDNVKIVSQTDWDNNKIENDDGSESIDHKTGKSISKKFSEESANMTDEQILNVYDHYNPTNLELIRHPKENGIQGGMQYYARINSKKMKILEEAIRIRIDGNNYQKASDHANEIKNMFAHENNHYNSVHEFGVEDYLSQPRSVREIRAIKAQMRHPSWNGTREGYKNGTKAYAKNFGMMFIEMKKIELVLL